MNVRGIGCALILGWANHVYSQSIDDDLSLSFGDEEFVSIATGMSQSIAKAPAVASVFTQNDIQNMGATNLDEVLEAVPGLHVSSSSIRFTPVYQIRGIATDINPHVLVLVNGIPITQLYFGDRGVRSTLPLSDIARVEIIRGPGSAVYGADAFAGVINVITKTPNDTKESEVGVRSGSFNSQSGWISYSDSLSQLNYRVSMEFSKTDGDEERIILSDAQSFFDGIFGTSASLAPGPVDTRSERLDIRMELSGEKWIARFWNWRQKDLGLGPGIAMALDPVGKTEVDNYLLDLSSDWDVSENLALNLKAAFLDLEFTNDFVIFPPNSVLPIRPDGNVGPGGGVVMFTDGLLGNPDVFEKHLKLDASMVYSGLNSHRIRVAAGSSLGELDASETKNFGPGIIDGTEGVVDGGLTDVTGTPFVFIENEDRTVYYASIQDEWSYAPDWTLTAGIRHDNYSDFGSTTNPRLALVWNARHNVTAKLLYGRAFRAPSFAELFAINNPIVLGNQDLDPEVIDTYEIAMDYTTSYDLRVGFNIFYYNVEDLIQFVPDSSGASSTAQNTGRQSGRGAEIEFDWDASNTFSLLGHVAFQNSKDKATETDSPNSPELQAYLGSNWKFSPGWLLSIQAHWISDRNRRPGDPRKPIDDYFYSDISIQKQAYDKGWRVVAGIRNLSDEGRNEPSPMDINFPSGSAVPGDFPLEQRSYYLEASYKYD